MKHFYRNTVAGLSLAAVVAAGCATDKKKDANMARLGDESPPEFISGPASAALRDFDGFSANVVQSASPANAAPPVSGQLIGRQGRLIFQPWSTALAKKGKVVKGGMFFLWDTDGQRGFVVSEALQGFAPIAALAPITNVVAEPTALDSGPINGHPCHQVEAVVTLKDGSTARLTEWLADDLQRFPVRLRASGGGREITLDMTEVRLDLAAPELFLPPSDFTRYASSLALMNELMIREASNRQAPSEAITGEQQPAISKYNGQQGQPGMMR